MHDFSLNEWMQPPGQRLRQLRREGSSVCERLLAHQGRHMGGFTCFKQCDVAHHDTHLQSSERRIDNMSRLGVQKSRLFASLLCGLKAHLVLVNQRPERCCCDRPDLTAWHVLRQDLPKLVGCVPRTWGKPCTGTATPASCARAKACKMVAEIEKIAPALRKSSP